MTAIDRQRVGRLARDGRAAVGDSLARVRLVRAWDLLQERDADGNALGPLPYTPAAVAELEAVHCEDPEDFGVVHHLAIAFHARAWDLELAGDPAAAAAWEEALGYWRILAFAAGFWNALKEKFRACDAGADVALLDAAQKSLLEDLLDIHVDFVCRYCEQSRFDRALSHVGIVNRANIPPAKKLPLVEKIFKAMTAGVAAAKLAREFDSALIAVERFLAIFPEYLPALRMHAEVCTEWVAGMHFADHWGEITRLGERAESHAERLASHPALQPDALAKTALVNLGGAFAFQAYQHAATYLAKLQDVQDFDILADEARTALTLGIPWGRRAGRAGQEASQEGGQARDCLAALLGCRGWLLYNEAGIHRDRAEAIARLRWAASDLKEATLVKADQELVELHEQVQRRLAQWGPACDEDQGSAGGGPPP
jgi:hypothetical protein